MLVGYMRVSSADDRQSVDLQRDALVAAGVDERHLHTDKASGARDDRPGLKACLEYLKAGDTLVVWKLDRLGRSLPHLIEVVRRIEAQGTGFVSLTEAIDTTTSSGRLLFHMMGALAEFERALIKQRTDEGRQAAKRRGVSFGRPQKLRPDQKTLALSLVQEGRSISEVARTFNVHPATIHRCLNAPKTVDPAL